MSLESRHFINGEEIRPKDADEIGFKIDWTSDAEEAEINVDTVILERRAKQLVLEHIETYGVFEGIPYQIQIEGLILDYYIDLTESPKVSGPGDSSIEVSLKRRKAIDYFNQQTIGLSFEAINITHPIAIIDNKYVIIKDNQATMFIMLSISIYTLTRALITGIQEIAEAAADFANTLPPTISNIGAVVAAFIKLVARIIATAAILIALIDLTKQIIELVFPPLRRFKVATVKELMTRGCAKLGFEFQSTLIDALPELTIQPVPLVKENESIFNKLFTLSTGFYTKGYPTARDTVPTLGALIEELKKMFNAKPRIVNGVYHLEQRDHWILNSSVNITSTLNLQNIRENRWTYNIGDAWKRYFLHYQTDPTDLHTLDKIDRTDVELSTEPILVNNADLILIKGLATVPINLAFGIRKELLNAVEKLALSFAVFADSVINFFGGNSSLQSKVQGRIGAMQISQQYFIKTKILYLINGNQPSNYLDKIGAIELYNKHHAINQVKENFKRIYSETIPFSTAQFLQLIDNNYVNDQYGNSLEILTFDWTNESKQAEITYAILSDEGDNTKTILIDG